MRSRRFNTYSLSLDSISRYIPTYDIEKGNESGFGIDLQIASQACGIQWETIADRVSLNDFHLTHSLIHE